MSKAAVVLELANSCLLEVSTHLSLIVRVHSSYIVSARVVFWHRIVDASFLIFTMGKGASISQATSAIFFEMAAHCCLVLNVGHLVFIIALVAKVSITIILIVVLLLSISISLLIAGGMLLTLQRVSILLRITDLVTLTIDTILSLTSAI